MMNQPNPARIGRVELGSFHLLGLLGQGSFASAFLANQLGTDRQAVVKIAHEHLLQRADRGAIKARFLDEVRASTRCQHPNLVTVYTAGETHDGLPAIAMEFVPGDALESCLERSAPLGITELAYFPQLASALATIHRMGIVHRDVSPGNIIVTRDHDGSPRAKLLDFGIAKLEGVSQSRGPMGTPRYAAPEQVTGSAVPASDVYGLGAILWWALAGRPYLGELDTVDRIVSHQLHMTSAPDPREVNQRAAPSLAELAMRMLSPKPEERPTSEEVLARWPAALTEARAWRRRAGGGSLPSTPAQTTRPLQLVVVDPSPVKRHLVAGYAARLGCATTLAEDPRELTRGLVGPFDVALLATELPGVDAAAVSRHLREHYPAQRVVLMSSQDERVLDCADAGADILLTIPGELGRLGDYLDTLRRRANSQGRTPIRTLDTHDPVSSTGLDAWVGRPDELRAAVSEFVGTMPTLITQLDAIEHRGCTPDTLRVCERIEARAAALGALHLARLAKSVRLLLEAGELSSPAGYVAELESEYQRVFRRLLLVLQ